MSATQEHGNNDFICAQIRLCRKQHGWTAETCCYNTDKVVDKVCIYLLSPSFCPSSICQICEIHLNTHVQYSLPQPLCIIVGMCGILCVCVCVSVEQTWSCWGSLYPACLCSSPPSFPSRSVGSVLRINSLTGAWTHSLMWADCRSWEFSLRGFFLCSTLWHAWKT